MPKKRLSDEFRKNRPDGGTHNTTDLYEQLLGGFYQDSLGDELLIDYFGSTQDYTEYNDVTKFEAWVISSATFLRFHSTATVDIVNVRKKAEGIINKLLDNEVIIINLSEIRLFDDYTFEHSVNVCVLSLIAGIILGYDNVRLMDLGVGAILHDTGKIRVKEGILNKPAKLSKEEIEEVKNHPYYSYQLLKSIPGISETSALIAYSHHERFDGGGYPQKLNGNQIIEEAKICAVADVYDALTTDRVYRKKLRPFEVMEYMSSLSELQFEQKIIHTFISFVDAYPSGTGVVLDSKTKGTVIRVNENSPSRPVVKIFPNGSDISKNQEIILDLSQLEHIQITGIYEIDTSNQVSL